MNILGKLRDFDFRSPTETLGKKKVAAKFANQDSSAAFIGSWERKGKRKREREKKRRKTVKEKGLKRTRQRAQALYKRGALIKSRVLIF